MDYYPQITKALNDEIEDFIEYLITTVPALKKTGVSIYKPTTYDDVAEVDFKAHLGKKINYFQILFYKETIHFNINGSLKEGSKEIIISEIKKWTETEDFKQFLIYKNFE